MNEIDCSAKDSLLSTSCAPRLEQSAAVIGPRGAKHSTPVPAYNNEKTELKIDISCFLHTVLTTHSLAGKVHGNCRFEISSTFFLLTGTSASVKGLNFPLTGRLLAHSKTVMLIAFGPSPSILEDIMTRSEQILLAIAGNVEYEVVNHMESTYRRKQAIEE